MAFVTGILPDFSRSYIRLAGFFSDLYKYKRGGPSGKYDMREAAMSIARIAGAYGFFKLSEKALGAVTFAAMKDNKLMTAGLVFVEGLISVPTLLIHVGGVAIRNNLPELFKAWTEKSVSSHAIGLACLAAGVILLTSRARHALRDENHNDVGIIENALANAIDKKLK
ncbi:MAG: hypothetical protein JSR58_04705 [Verrucomicrobia bacterium]|nr:hypothetical protein [Verrucomicrobiota bacterium]